MLLGAQLEPGNQNALFIGDVKSLPRCSTEIESIYTDLLKCTLF